jgi:hypothetical protein
LLGLAPPYGQRKNKAGCFAQTWREAGQGRAKARARAKAMAISMARVKAGQDNARAGSAKHSILGRASNVKGRAGQRVAGLSTHSL